MNDSTTKHNTPGRRPAASENATMVYRLPRDKKQKIHAKLAGFGLTIQGFMSRAIELALAELRTEKN